MKIKQIEIKGFKSFRNRTVVRFDKGISCIVGPNGCGKSNVVDAFLWVMGETAPKQLRGSAMEDVIFAGAGSHPPAAVAEVSLVIEQSKEAPPLLSTVFPLPSSGEFMLTRRLDRDGRSDYLLNSKPCRLKDVQEIFMDTGAGVHGFSFIEQGEVEQFISSKPEQKHRMIEAVAGISRFRSRKKEAERKLDLTEGNLKRLKDIVNQQTTQLEKLKKQSEKAERFRDLKKEIKEKDILLMRWEFSEIQKEKHLTKKQIQSAEQKNKDRKKILKDTSLELEKLEDLGRQKKELWESSKKKAESARKELFSLEKELTGLKAVLQAHRQNLSSSSVEMYQENRRSTLSQLKESTTDLLELEKKQTALQEKAEQIKAQWLTAEEKASQMDQTRRSLEQELSLRSHKEALSEERVQSVEEKIKEESVREKEHQNLLKENTQALQKWETKKKLLLEKQSQNKQLSFNIKDSTQEWNERVSSLEKEITEQSTLLNRTREEHIALLSEKESLKKLTLQKEEEGLNFVLQSSEEKEFFTEVASAVRLRSSFLEEAVSSYMERRLKSVFCSDEKKVLSVAEKLKKNQKGLCGFIFPQGDKKKVSEEKAMVKESGVEFLLKDQAEGKAELIDWLFARVAVVKDISTAFRLKEKYPQWSFITLSKEVITLEGDMIGGFSLAELESSQGASNILSYQRAMKELPLKCSEKKKQIDLISSRLKKTKEILQKTKEKLFDFNKEEDQVQITLLELNKDLENLEKEESRLKREGTELRKKIIESQSKIKEGEKKQALLKEEVLIAKAEKGEQDLQNIIVECENSAKEKESLFQQKDKIGAEIAETGKELARLREKKLLMEESLKQQDLAQKKMLSRTLEDKALLKTREEKLHNTETETQKRKKETTLAEQKTTELAKEVEHIEEQTQQKRDRVMQLHQEPEQALSALNDLKLNLESLSLKQSSLQEKIQERYQVDLTPLKEQEKLFSSMEDFKQAGVERDKLSQQLARMGEVNLLALREYEELVKENEFYQKHYEDLCISKEKLLQAIRQIDRFCSGKFKEVFEEVNSCFCRVWPSLFSGGKAELVLVGGKDQEPAGMEIMVQPPGKKVQNMNLLSGGEKAMTAVAVLFSIFLVQPSPFCILDEVDASLDDVNIVRFNSLLLEMAKVSQMIVITHNKYTMKSCDYLYGVTMEEKGISKIMSLDMKSARAETTL